MAMKLKKNKRLAEISGQKVREASIAVPAHARTPYQIKHIARLHWRTTSIFAFGVKPRKQFAENVERRHPTYPIAVLMCVSA
jgi:hypothetical protein